MSDAEPGTRGDARARVEFAVESPHGPEAVLANLVEFGERRPTLWPAIDPSAYEVHALGGWAEVTEGSDVLGVVEATIQESNFWHPGGIWRLRAELTPGGGSRLSVTRDRRAKNGKARVLEAMLRIAGSRMLAAELRKAPALGIVKP